jgi:hypothetical protein
MPERRDEPNAMEIVIAPDAGPPRNCSLAEGGRIRTSVTVTRKVRKERTALDRSATPPTVIYHSGRVP